MKKLVDRLAKENDLTAEELRALLLCQDIDTMDYLGKTADKVRKQTYGNEVYIRGLIEFTNICKNDCYYCGIRKSNEKVSRYRLTEEDILKACENGYSLGFRTFVLQGGEDPYWDDDKLVHTVKAIRTAYPDCAITLSAGEKTRESYQRLFDAGADRYLLRHETANGEHYSRLHPDNLSLKNRLECLYNLKEIGYQTGCGFMVGSPYQTVDNIVEDLKFIKKFQPQMVGIGPFLAAQNTPFASEPNGSAELTIKILSMVRLLIPRVLLPATTALGTAESDGREKGIMAGANVVMPNLSPADVRKKYMLYDNKIATGDEAAESVAHLQRSMNKIGYNVVFTRGDYIK